MCVYICIYCNGFMFITSILGEFVVDQILGISLKSAQ